MSSKSDKKKSETKKASRQKPAVEDRSGSGRVDADESEMEQSASPAETEERGPGGLVIPGGNLIGTTPEMAPAAAEPDAAPAELGTARYVQAAFFVAALIVTYIAGKILLTIWNRLAEWPAAVRSVPALLSVGELERGTYTMLVGVLVGIAAVVYTYRKQEVRQWANDVALELSKVTWPNREAVTNGTIVVLAASAVATVYVMLLDRFWGFLTSLIYET